MAKNNIKTIRIAMDLSQIEFARKLNVDQTAVSNWETGKNSISPEIAKEISKIAKVPLEYVYGFEIKGYRKKMNDLRDCYKQDIINARTVEEAEYLKIRYLCPIYNEDENHAIPIKDGITKEEQQLLNLFRELPSDLKQHMVIYAKTLKAMALKDTKV